VLVATFIGAVDEARTAATSDPAAAEEYRRAIEALAASLRRLSDEQFKLVVLVYREEIDLDEAGAMLGLTYATVKRRHSEALAVLRGDLVTHGVPRAPPPRDMPVDDVL
jgi:DNA-directed RNA polymerase specialized sigma24 family protein